MSSQIELVERLNETIRMQSSVIDDLFQLLLQHTSLQEMEQTLEKIKKVAEKCKELEERM